MVWGAISTTGAVAFDFVFGRINSNTYIQLLSRTLIPSLDRMPLHQLRNIVFQQDNARYHVSARTMRFFEENGIEVTSWPAKSPDLNPIEKIWAFMKLRLCRQHCNSVRQFRQAIQSAWTQVATPDLCSRLITGLPRKMKEVIDRRGSRWVTLLGLYNDSLKGFDFVHKLLS